MNTSADYSRYFLALIPPEPFFSQTQEFKLYFKENYKSCASLNSPPHITLHMPFLFKPKKEAKLINELTVFATSQKAFSIKLENFNHFGERVIYIQVNQNESLNLFQKNLERFCKKQFQLFNANRLDQAYHPHLTLAFRDLKKNNFIKAWDEFSSKKYNAEWPAQNFSLLKHDGERWLIHHSFNLIKTIF